MRHGSHQMTTLVLAHKDGNAILEPSAFVVRCALVNKLYHTNVSCEWVSCLHSPSIFWNSFQETEITTISQMMWNTMSSNSFAMVRFATAKLKMKTLPAGVPVALCSNAMQFSDRHCNQIFLLLRIVDLLVDVVDVLDVSVSECCVSAKRASCILRHCILGTNLFISFGPSVSSVPELSESSDESSADLRVIFCSILCTDLLRLRGH